MPYISPRAPHNESRLAWLKRVHTQPCPECQPATPIPPSVYQQTAWCPICEYVWRVFTRGGGMLRLWYPEANPTKVKAL